MLHEPLSTSSLAVSSPRPSMSRALREPRWKILPTNCAGQSKLFGQTEKGPRSIERRVAGRAGLGQTKRLRPLAARLRDPLDDLRYDITGSLDPNLVALPNVLPRHLLAVVQGRPAHGHAADLHRSHQRDRGHHTGATDAGDDLVETGDLLARRELESESPTRMMRGGAQLLPGGQIVELDHHTVDLVADVVAPSTRLR